MKNNYIGLMVDDTPALAVGLQGIMKSGNTFVPLNPVFPEERIHFILNDCRVGVLVTDESNYSKAMNVARESRTVRHLLCLDGGSGEVTARHSFDRETHDTPVDTSAGTPGPGAYVIYTSGSTGKPKGVPIAHRHLAPLLIWFVGYFRLNRYTRVLHNLSYTFDFGVFEILTTLMVGGMLVMSDKKAMGDYSGYADFINEYDINTVHTTPAFFSSIVSAGKTMPTLDIVHLGGEALTGGLVRRISRLVGKDCRIYNGYGPTEATINCSIYSVTAEQRQSIDENEIIPIGKPTALHTLYILDKHGRMQPVGVPGELCVAGDGVADGYLNRPELTAERFIDLNKTHKSYRSYRTYYRTGDLVSWLPDGNIRYLGRIDQQVKIRGYRIELGEIETCLLGHNAVAEAVVTARKDEGREQRYLCAYIVARDETLTLSQLRDYLLTALPDYMVPAYFITLDRIPLTPNGKVNHRALPAPSEDIVMAGTSYTPPENETEQRMAAIWQELLGIQKVGMHDDFFMLGGDSILAGQCVARFRKAFSVDLSLRKLFEQPTVRALSMEVDSRKPDVTTIKKASRDEDIPLSFAQERLWFLQKLDRRSLAYFVPRVIRFIGKLDKQLLDRTFCELVRRHEILRTVFPVKDGRPVQRVLDPYDFKIGEVNFSGSPEPGRSAAVARWIDREGRRGFDFEYGPLLRVSLLKLKEEEHLVVLTEHHLIHDGWTQGVLLREFIALFTAFREGKSSPLPELPIQYADFAVWQREHMQGEVLERHQKYWKKKLGGLAPVLELPADRPRPNTISGRGGLIPLVIPAPLTSALKDFCKKEGVTLFMTMLTVFKVFLYRYTGVDDLCVGTGAANRRMKEMEHMLGMVINTLALRTQLGGGLTFRECMDRVKQTCVEAYEHEDTPFEKVVEVLRPERNLAYTPIFQVLFGFMDTPTERLALPGLELVLEDSHNRSSKFDLNLVVVPPMEQGMSNEEILVEWEYNSDIFNHSTALRMSDLYHRLLEEAILKPDAGISSLQMMEGESAAPDREKDNLEVEFNF